MNLIETENRTEELIQQFTALWEGSVRATHLFLSPEEIAEIKKYVPQALRGVARLVIAQDAQENPVGFMGVENQKLEMLFIAPQERGCGIGKKLMQYGILNYNIREVGVNEQNPQAVGFYTHMGFRLARRAEIDEQGQPYPILYMKLEA
ncbi:GNAT family N-acetyltransferase [Ihubacter sp. mB4P-1]|uniref:GNAT family N-acetyltransferase n=1 Tax=Ihubacter sp. mB4P-1 TaxID=3242370 RepID=UPI00137B6A2F